MLPIAASRSIHAWGSWLFATGATPCIATTPSSHGPFLFHANALVYFLFGGKRCIVALPAGADRRAARQCAMAVAWNPFPGRWGALVAGFMLLISPSFLDYTRYLRHDPYTCIGAIALCIAIFRYLENPQRRGWTLLAFTSVAFMLANHEIVFAILLAFVALLLIALLWGLLRPLVPVCLATAGAGLLLLEFPGHPFAGSGQGDIPGTKAFHQDAGEVSGAPLGSGSASFRRWV